MVTTEPHVHDWQEEKVYFGVNKDDKYITTRYCKSCGDTQTYHGKEKYWIYTGNINDINKK